MSKESVPSNAKKQRTDDSLENNFFKEFLKKDIERELLNEAYVSLCDGSSDMIFRTLKIQQSNALISEGFSRASCNVKMYEKIRTGAKPLARIFAAGSVFKNGIFILKKFLAPNPEVPEDLKQKEALRKLLNFLLNDDSALLDNDSCDKAEWAVRVAQHLLLPLTATDSFTIDQRHRSLNKILPKCPCKEGDRVNGNLGDTSFGWIDGWHGSPDILVNSVTVDLAYPVDDLEIGSSASSFSSVSSPEVKASSHFNENDQQQQVLAQTIVNSFLQCKENRGKLRHCLVPGIGISKDKVVIYLYDCEEDVLLGTTQMDLFAYKSLYYKTVVLLWLTLNYEIFCTGITNSMKCLKAEFFQRVGSFLENYRNDVCRNIPKQSMALEKDSGWTKNGAVDEKIDVNKNNEDLGIIMKPL